MSPFSNWGTCTYTKERVVKLNEECLYSYHSRPECGSCRHYKKDVKCKGNNPNHKYCKNYAYLGVRQELMNTLQYMSDHNMNVREEVIEALAKIGIPGKETPYQEVYDKRDRDNELSVKLSNKQ